MQLQEWMQQWILIDMEIQKRQQELDKLRLEREKLETSIYEHAKRHELINKKIKTTSGKNYIFRERNIYQSISQKFLKETIDAFFTNLKNLSQTTASNLFDYIVKHRMSKKYFEIEKK